MSRSDMQPTRTAEVGFIASGEAVDSAAGAVRSAGAPSDWLGRTEILPLTGEADGAAVSFARERERAMARLDHSASVRRLRRALSIGLVLWLSVLGLDLFVTQFVGEGDLSTFVWCRAVGALCIAAVLWRLRREPEPTPAVSWFCDIFAFTAAAVCIGVTALAFRGIESPYAGGIVVVLLARGATTLAPWRLGMCLFAAPALAYPSMVLVASRFDAELAAQLHSPPALATFTTQLFNIALSCVLCVMGGHFAWRLRREAVQTRNIGRYKLERRLGGGGMGDVWAAFDLTLRQRVALKTVSGHRPGSPVLLRLEREVRALAELTHPNTVRVFDYGVTDDGLWYYTMDLLHGVNLGELVQREGPLPAERLLPIARQALRALGEAHERGIIHRDIKPENVFVAQIGGETDFVKLLDFGIARSSGDTRLTNTGFVAGTPAYMAPEIILSRPADIRSDIYSFGVLLHYALTARLPFCDDEPMALFAAHVSRPLKPLSSISSRPIPLALEHVVQCCMAKDPADRFASTQRLLEALDPILAERHAPRPDGLDSSRA
jgi:eukaryotic-like serine/threonine-protein kinase